MGIPFCGMRQPENGVEWCLLGWTGFQAAFGVVAGAGLFIARVRCCCAKRRFGLKPLQNLQPIACRRLADILANQSCFV